MNKRGSGFWGALAGSFKRFTPGVAMKDQPLPNRKRRRSRFSGNGSKGTKGAFGNSDSRWMVVKYMVRDRLGKPTGQISYEAIK